METVNSPGPAVPYAVPFAGPVRTARFLGRRARFLMDLEDASGRFTAHTNNTGTMLGLLRPGCEVLVSVSAAPGRKYPCTVEALRHDGFWVGVNTAAPTRVLRAAWERGLLPGGEGYDRMRTEPAFEGGRLDALFTGPAGELYVETKNVTLVEEDTAQFPDAPTERGRKHLGELARLARMGGGVRAALFLAVQRPDGACFGPAWAVDPQYGEDLLAAMEAGVEVWPLVVDVSPDGLRLGRMLPLAACLGK